MGAKNEDETALCVVPPPCSCSAPAAELAAVPSGRQPAPARTVPADGGRRWAGRGSRPVLAADTVRICIRECVGADSSITLSGFTWGYPSE